ncbi:MAG TPA: T9SS type A sorting domain-containing protein, partial [Chryseolinea sp.]|nr:T9SS type A sorting domain-containing protein [Chryseolinea sp.]
GSSQSNASGDKSQDNNGGVVDYWIIRIDDLGIKVWDKTFGGDADDYLGTVTLAADGFLLGGGSNSNISGDKSEDSKGFSDFWIIKVDMQGTKVWDKTIGGPGVDNFASIIPASGGGYLLAGNAQVIKIDADGNIVWDKNYAGNLEEQFTSIVSVPDGGYLLTGVVFSDATRSDFWVTKLDTHGNKVWHKIIGGSGNDLASAAAVASSGKFLVAGYSDSDVSGDKSENSRGGFDYWVVALKAPNHPVVTSLTLMNAHTDREIQELKDGDVINLTECGNLLDIRANITADKITKVSFNLNGPVTHQQTETVSPYALFGDQDGNFFGKKLVPGAYRLTVTPYVNGIKGAVHTISFTVIKGASLKEGRLQVEVYPLPASGVINIRHEGRIEQAQMTLLDFNGNVLLNRPLSQESIEQLDVSKFRKGIHYLKVASPEGLQIIRIVVE